MTNKEIRHLLNRILGVNDIRRIVEENVPEIIEHAKNSFGVRNLGAELNELAMNNIDKIVHSFNQGYRVHLTQNDARTLTVGLSGILGSITPDKLPTRDINTQLRDLMAELSEGNEEEEDEDNIEE